MARRIYKVIVWLCSLAALTTALSGAGVVNVAPGAAVSAVPAAPPRPTTLWEPSEPSAVQERWFRVVRWLSRLRRWFTHSVTSSEDFNIADVQVSDLEQEIASLHAFDEPLAIQAASELQSKGLAKAIQERWFRTKRWFSHSHIGRWLTGGDREIIEERRLQPGTDFPCRPSRRPGEYGVILDIPPQRIEECVKITTTDIFGVNHRMVDLTFGKFGGLELLMIAQRRGPVLYIEVINQGDYAHYDINKSPLKVFRDHSCLNRNMWCFVAQVQAIDWGFLVIDRHRIIQYNYTWLLDGDTAASDIDDTYINQFGFMNSQLPDNQAGENEKLTFPTAVAEYKPFNASLVSDPDDAMLGDALSGVPTLADTNIFAITPLIPHAWCRFLFVTDTGSHRLMMLNATLVGQFDYIGQYGITGEARDNSTGFNWPWGVAVSSPAWEGRYEPAFANVFVVDRRNHRLVKLNLGYPLLPCEYDLPDQTEPLLWEDEDEKIGPMCRNMDKPRLYYSAEYGQAQGVKDRPEGLTDPTAVGIYRHFIVVAEVEGNAITLLRVDHNPPYGLVYVTYFKPVQGVYMQGGMATSPFGYVWYNYIGKDMENKLSSMYLPEIIRESKPPNRFKEFLEICVNTTFYDELMDDRKRYVEHVSFILNASVINWEFPDSSNYMDIFMYNESNVFDYDGLNRVVYNGSMEFCEPPTTPTPPPFFGGNEEGWVIDGKSQSEFTKRSGVPRSSHILVSFVTCCISALIPFVLA